MALRLVLGLEVSEHSGNLLITQILPLLPRSAEIRVLVVDPKICISKRPHDQVGEPLFENILCFGCGSPPEKSLSFGAHNSDWSLVLFVFFPYDSLCSFGAHTLPRL